MKTVKTVTLLGVCAGLAFAQAPNPTVTTTVTESQSGAMPLYRVTVVGRTTKAVNYRHRSGSTKVDFRGTALLPEARGEAKVESKQGRIEVDAEMDHLQPASRFGPEYLTYVLWAVTPEGRANNLGEVLLNGTKSKLNVTTDLQAFGLIVTAEPYFGVTQPSDVVVMENMIRTDTLGKVEEIEAHYELLKRGQYTLNANPATLRPILMDPKVAIELYEARNAVQIAQWTGADKYAPETYQKAVQLLQQAEDYHRRKQKKPTSMIAREAVQTSEDARAIAVRRQDEERLALERQAAADREAKATAAAAEAARQQQLAEQQRQLEMQRAAIADQQRLRAEQERAAAERAKAEADAAAQRAAAERAQAEAAKAAALAQQQVAMQEADRARTAANEADRLRQQAENDKTALRKQLLDQLNLILETRDTARGLIVNMSDVLFDTARWTLKPGAREKLAKISGIVLSHPGLKLDVEGHTDSVGGDQYNQGLSEKRAMAVRDFLVQQGVPPDAVTSRGFGKTMPVASNDTAAGRQQNRRVELVVSGEVIGGKIGGGN